MNILTRTVSRALRARNYFEKIVCRRRKKHKDRGVVLAVRKIRASREAAFTNLFEICGGIICIGIGRTAIGIAYFTFFDCVLGLRGERNSG